MNERIKELTGKALDQAMPQTWYGISPDDLDRIAAKLAELVVRECANIVNSLEQHEGQGDCSTAEYIKEHFGVEE